MKIVIYVMNDVSRDSRVIREARTLVEAGHDVTVMATTTDPDQPTGTTDSRDRFAIIRVAIPRGWPLWFVWLKHPWRLRRRVAREVVGAAFHPARWPRALAFAVGAVVSLPWVVVRGAWSIVQFGLLRRKHGIGPIDYILRWREVYLAWDRAAVRHAPKADVHQACDLDTLPAAVAAARRDRGRVVYDSHEVYLEFGDHRRQPWWLRKIMARWERSMSREAAAIITVNDACALELVERLHRPSITVVHNCPPRWTPPDPPQDRIRRAAGIPAEVPVVLCHGGFQASRGIEQTVLAMTKPALAMAHMVFLGYRTVFLDPLIEAFPDPERIHVLPAVDPDEVLPWVAGADVDVMVFQPTELNNIVSTPNKLFESIAAGVPVVSSDFPVRRRIVMEDPAGPLGAVCDPTDPDAVAAAIASILDRSPDERQAMRARCTAAAAERWNWEIEGAKLAGVYGELAGVYGELAGSPT